MRVWFSLMSAASTASSSSPTSNTRWPVLDVEHHDSALPGTLPAAGQQQRSATAEFQDVGHAFGKRQHAQQIARVGMVEQDLLLAGHGHQRRPGTGGQRRDRAGRASADDRLPPQTLGHDRRTGGFAEPAERRRRSSEAATKKKKKKNQVRTQSTATVVDTAAAQPKAALERGIDWTGAFWVASGVPPLVLFSIGAVAAIVGKLSWIVWTVSIAMGFVQSFTYAEIAGLFPNKSGGASVYGAIAWVRYGKLFAPISVWCNWFAWSPVLAIGSGLAAGYILDGLFAPDAAINTWQFTLLDLGCHQERA